MKRILTRLLLTSFFMGFAVFSKAQNAKPGWGFRTECLTMTAWTENVKTDSCTKVYWQIAGQLAGNGSQLSYKFAKRGTYQVCMKVLNSCKKWDTIICKSVTVDTCKSTNPCDQLKPNFEFKIDCRKVKFYAISGMNSTTGVSYSWSFGNGSSASTGDPLITYTKDGVYKVCLKATWKVPGTTTVCVKEICKEIKVACNPCEIKGEFGFSIGQGGQVKFKAASNTGFTYTWDFGDGNKGTGQNPVHQYKKPGTYKVCVRICDKTGRCCTTVCRTVVIEEPCRIRGEFGFKGLGNGKFQFIAFSNDKNATYIWSFGDGTSGTGRDPQHTYTKSGTYTVCVTIISGNKRCKVQYCRKVVVEAKPCNWSKAGYVITSTNTCAIVKVEAFNLNDQCITYNWTVNGVAVDNVGGRLKTLELPKNGVYKICLKLVDNCKKCDTVICKEVKVSCYPEKCDWTNAGFGISATSRCGTFTAEANNMNNSCISYQWIVKQNGSIISTDTASGRLKTFSFDKNGVYVVCLKLVNTCKKCDTFICKEVEVKCYNTEKCNWKDAGAKVSYKIDCNKITVEAANLNNTCIKYGWFSNGSVVSSNRTATFTYSQNGTYYLCAKFMDTCKKCDTSICIQFKIDCQPCGAISYFTVDSIRKGTVYLTNRSKNAYSYKWSFGDTTFSKDKDPGSKTYKYSGAKTICLTVWDSLEKCSSTFCKTIQVVTGRSNEATADINPSFKAWPNPASETLNISWSGNQGTAYISDMNGRLVMTREINGSINALPVSGLAEGMYILKLVGPGSGQSTRFIISR